MSIKTRIDNLKLLFNVCNANAVKRSDFLISRKLETAVNV